MPACLPAWPFFRFSLLQALCSRFCFPPDEAATGQRSLTPINDHAAQSAALCAVDFFVFASFFSGSSLGPADDCGTSHGLLVNLSRGQRGKEERGEGGDIKGG